MLWNCFVLLFLTIYQLNQIKAGGRSQFRRNENENDNKLRDYNGNNRNGLLKIPTKAKAENENLGKADGLPWRPNFWDSFLNLVNDHQSTVKHRNLTENLTSHVRVKRARRRNFVVKCCGTNSCSEESADSYERRQGEKARKQQEANLVNQMQYKRRRKWKKNPQENMSRLHAYGVFTDAGIHISCSGCPSGWPDMLTIYPDFEFGIPVSCFNCPMNWPGALNLLGIGGDPSWTTNQPSSSDNGGGGGDNFNYYDTGSNFGGGGNGAGKNPPLNGGGRDNGLDYGPTDDYPTYDSEPTLMFTIAKSKTTVASSTHQNQVTGTNPSDDSSTDGSDGGDYYDYQGDSTSESSGGDETKLATESATTQNEPSNNDETSATGNDENTPSELDSTDAATEPTKLAKRPTRPAALTTAVVKVATSVPLNAADGKVSTREAVKTPRPPEVKATLAVATTPAAKPAATAIVAAKTPAPPAIVTTIAVPARGDGLDFGAK